MTADEPPEDWTDEALDRLRAALLADPVVKNERANPVKEESRG